MEWIKADDMKPPTEKPVLAVTEDGKNRNIIRACWVEEHTLEADDYEGDSDYDEEGDTYYWPEGWYEWNLYDERHWAVADHVTHWMHLPRLPEDRPYLKSPIKS